MRAAFSPAESVAGIHRCQLSGFRQGAGTRCGFGTQPRDRWCAEFPLDGRLQGIGVCQGWADAGDFHRLWDISPSGACPTEPDWPVIRVNKSALEPGTGFAATSDLGLAAYGTGSGQIRVMDLHDGKELWTAVASKTIGHRPGVFTGRQNPGVRRRLRRVRHPLMGCRHRQGNRAAGRPQSPGSAPWCSGRMAKNWPRAAPIKRFGSGTWPVASVWTCCAGIVWKCGGWPCCRMTKRWSAAARTARFAFGTLRSRTRISPASRFRGNVAQLVFLPRQPFSR